MSERFRERYEDSSRKLEIQDRLRSIEFRIKELSDKKIKTHEEEDELEGLIREKETLDRELKELE